MGTPFSRHLLKHREAVQVVHHVSGWFRFSCASLLCCRTRARHGCGLVIYGGWTPFVPASSGGCGTLFRGCEAQVLCLRPSRSTHSRSHSVIMDKFVFYLHSRAFCTSFYFTTRNLFHDNKYWQKIKWTWFQIDIFWKKKCSSLAQTSWRGILFMLKYFLLNNLLWKTAVFRGCL